MLRTEDPKDDAALKMFAAVTIISIAMSHNDYHICAVISSF